MPCGNFSTTEIAVAGVLSAFGGGLLVGLLSFLIVRYSGKHACGAPPSAKLVKSLQIRAVEDPQISITQPPTTERAPANQIRARYFLDNHLPTPYPTRALEQELSRIGSHIDRYVVTYFGGFDPPDIVVDDGSIQSKISFVLGATQPILKSAEFVELLSKGQERFTAARLLIGWALIRRVSLDCEPEQCLLPQDLLLLMRDMSGPGLSRRDLMALWAAWRRITGNLLKDKYVHAEDHQWQDSDPREKYVEKLATELDNILKPWAESQLEEDRLHELRQIIRRGAKWGLHLLYHPTTWQFDWSCPASEREGFDRLTIFPALAQIGDEEGNIRDPPAAISEVRSKYIQARGLYSR